MAKRSAAAIRQAITAGKGNPGNKGPAPMPREINLRDRGHLHPEIIAEILATTPARVREWIREKRLRSSFTWRGVSYVAARELENALVAGRLPGSEPGSGASTAPAFRGSPDTSRREIGAPARSGGLRTEAGRPEQGSSGNAGGLVPDFSTTVPAVSPVPYIAPDPRRLPDLPGNWEAVIADVDPRAVDYVRLAWLEGRSSGEIATAFGFKSATSVQGIKRKVLERLGI